MISNSPTGLRYRKHDTEMAIPKSDSFRDKAGFHTYTSRNIASEPEERP